MENGYQRGREVPPPLLDREDNRLQVVTVAEILAGERLSLPMAREDALKSAEAIGDRDKQGSLL